MKRFFSILLSICLCISMVPMTVMASDELPLESGSVTLMQGSTKIGDFDNINKALESVKEYDSSSNKTSYEIVLNENLKEDVVIPAKKIRVTIDLAGHKLSNIQGHTIHNKAVDNYPTKVIITDTAGNGVVDNTTNGRAAVYNDANSRIVLSGGTYTRSEEASISDSDGGGNSYYVIKNFGNMTIENGVTVKFSDENPGLYSSLIGNGWQDAVKAENESTEPKPSVGKYSASLTIDGGTFIGGQITVKNDDFGKLTIKDGSFTQVSDDRSAIANNNIVKIEGGTFTSKNSPVVYSRHYDTSVNEKPANDGTLTISGGTFKSDSNAILVETGARAEISGGTFWVDKKENVASGNGDIIFADEKEPVQNEDGSFRVEYADPIAIVIERGGEKTTYLDLREAMKNAPAGSTVKLMKDVSLEKGAKTENQGIILDLNGNNIDGTKVTSKDGVIYMNAAYGWKPVPDIDSTMRVINTVSNAGGEIKGTLPLKFKTGDSSYDLPGEIGEGITLTVTGNGSDAVALDSAAYLLYSENINNYIQNGGFKVTDADGIERLYGGYPYAANAAKAGTPVTMLNDYTGSGILNSGSSSGTLDLNGHAYTFTGTGRIAEVNYDDVCFTVKNGTLKAQNTETDGIWMVPSSGKAAKNRSIVLDHVTLTIPGDMYGIVTNGNNVDNAVTLRDSTLNAPNGLGIYFPSSGSVVIENSAINAKHFGVQMCAGSLAVSGDKTVVNATGEPQKKTDNDGPIVDGAAISIVNREGYKGIVDVSISGGAFKSNQKSEAVKAYKFNNNDKTEEIWNEAAEKVKISGGYFTSDPSKYTAKDYIVTTSDQNGYAYMVQKKTETKVPVEADIAEPSVPEELPDTIPADKVSAIKEAAAKTNVAEISAAAAAEANKITDEEATAIKAQSELKDEDDAEIEVRAYLDIQPKAYSENSYKLDITPVYEIVVISDSSDKEDIVQEKKPLNINSLATVSIPLPAGFVTNTDDVYVQHKGYEYIAEVTADSDAPDTAYTATFTNPHGFSEFTITTTPKAAAELNGVRYNDLQDALDKVKDRETIKLLKAPENKNYTMSGSSRTITLENPLGTEMKVKVNGVDYTVPANGTVDIKYTRPSSGGGGSVTTYAVTVDSAANGTVTASGKSASKGSTVTLTVKANEGYELDKLTVTDKDGKEIKVTDKGDGKYTFEMPASAVTVKASFAKKDVKPDQVAGFTDVLTTDWFADEVQYVVDHGMMNGTSETTFSPNTTTTRGMIVTILYRLEKEPAVDKAAGFADVAADQYYADAVAWASANGIVTGYSAEKFGPNDSITREQFAAILYRYAKYKNIDVTKTADLSGYADASQISAYAETAMKWANAEGLITGVTDTTLNPAGKATRAQAATILMRFCEETAK